MEYKNLECAYTIYKEKTITRASKVLYISQSSVTKRLKKLEEKLGFKIFIRNYNEMTLTSKGEVFIKDLEQLICIYKDTVKIYSNNIILKFLIGSSNLDFVIPIIKSFKDKCDFKEIKVIHSIFSTTDVINKLINNEINFSIFSISSKHFEEVKNTFISKNIKYKVLLKSNISIYFKNSPALYNKNNIYPFNLKGYTLIKKNPTNINYEDLTKLNNNLNKIEVSDTFEALLALEYPNSFIIGTDLDFNFSTVENIKSRSFEKLNSEVVYLYAFNNTNNSKLNLLNKLLTEEIEYYLSSR